MGEYLIDYYLHRKDYAPNTLPEHDTKLKELITCFAIHLTSRSAVETHAWTVHILADEPYSLFVTGNTGDADSTGIARGFIVGHVLTDNIRHTDVNAIHAQVSSRGNTHRSLVQCDSSDIPRMVEQFYDQSEQHPIRVLISQTSDTAIGLVGLPASDEDWIRGADLDAVSKSTELEKSPMRACEFAFACDCSPEKLMPFFKSLSQESLVDLYGDDDVLDISCPRCGRRFAVRRDEFGVSH
jgi:molecular chaperone Hsp33